MTKKNKNFTFKQCKDFAFESIKECKIRAIVLLIVMLVSLITGIIIAIKTHSNWGTANGLGIIDVKTGGLTSTFFTRFLSVLFIYLILFGASYISYLFPLAVIILGYRSYLLGLNTCLIIILHGFSGAILSMLIALPCQLLVLFTLAVFYILLCKTTKDYKCFGGSRIKNQKMLICLSALIILFALCVVESILLLIFNAKIILII